MLTNFKKRPTRVLSSLEFMKHMETMLLNAPRRLGTTGLVVEIPADNAEAWIAFLGQIITATEKRKETSHE